MGGGTEVIKSAQIVGLSKEYGKLKKKILLEIGKYIPSGMNTVVKAYGQNTVDLKGMYNKPYLKAMGYNPSDNTLINKISDGKVLEYTKNNIDSRATYILSPTIDTLSTEDLAILELQDKPNYKRSEKSFTHTDGKKYVYYTAVQNGDYIDISCCLNNIDTVTPYLVGKYPDGYRLLDMSTKPVDSNGSVYWIAIVEYTYFEDVVVEEEVIVDGKITIVQKIIKVKKKEIVSENIDCVFIYISIQDTEEADMNALAQQHSGPFTTTGTYTEENNEIGDTLHTVTVTGTFTVTYIGNGEFSYSMDAPNPYPGRWLNYEGTAWENGVRKYQSDKMTQIEQALESNIRSLIWEYGITKGDYDSIRRAYAPGNIIDSMIVKVYADSYPMIPLKRWFQLVNSKKMDLVLKKIGIEGKDFHDSIRQPEICDAYLFFGIPYNPGNPGLIEYIFEFFTTLTNVRENFDKSKQIYGSSSVNMSYDGMGILQNYNIESWIVQEPATRPVGTYWYQTTSEEVIVDYEIITVYNEDGWDSEIKKPIYETQNFDEYCYQESEAYYIKVRPKQIRYWYILGGEFWGNKTGFGAIRKKNTKKRDIELRIPILKQITNKMSFNLLCDVIEQSMSFAVYTQVEVKTKWYQSGFFKFVVAAVAMYFGQYWAVGVMMATDIAINVFGAKIGGILQIIVTVALIVTQNYGTALQMTVKSLMFTASQVLGLVSQVNNFLFSIKMESKQKEYDKILGSQEAEKEKLEEEYDKLYKNEGMIVNMFNNFKNLEDIDMYYNMAVGDFDSNYLMFEYATDYSKFYKV